jgi:hypothetical protein
MGMTWFSMQLWAEKITVLMHLHLLCVSQWTNITHITEFHDTYFQELIPFITWECAVPVCRSIKKEAYLWQV